VSWAKPKTFRINPIQPESEKIEEVVRLIQKGGVAAFPTDTVYGLGVDAENRKAVTRLYQAKNRSSTKPLVLFIAEKKKVSYFAQSISLKAKRLIREGWPGPLTLIFKAASFCPPALINEEGKVGIRFPAHPIPQGIIKKGKFPLATTSANISGKKSPLKLQEINRTLKNKIDLLIDGGESPLGKESTVIDVTGFSPRLIREGYLSWEKIKTLWDREEDILLVCTGNTCRSPMAEGLLKRAWDEKNKRKIKIHSAGINTISGLKPTEFAIKAMKHQDIDISSHLSVPLTREIVEEADLILVMERRHREKICEICPSAKDKVFLLKEFGLGREEEIIDPTGGSLKSYRKCAAEIKEAIKGVVKKLNPD
jgi:tRNA threonylcarbamoyl adenosine modification protein (Sua5/YciO/YrdC/YwlC family)